MRLTRENIQNKKEKRKTNRNRSNIEENQNIKYKIRNTYLQEKIKKFNKEKENKPFIKNKVQCTNIYKNNGKKIHYKHNSQMKTELEKYKIYEKNKIKLDTNNNINTGNNINIIMKINLLNN